MTAVILPAQQVQESVAAQTIAAPFAPCRSIALSVILPTYQEAENIVAAVRAVQVVLRHSASYEIIVVDDDSPDGTWSLVDGLAADDGRIRCHRRLDRRGLASAIVEGMAQGEGAVLAVMDADLQHDPSVLPDLVAALDGAEIAVASRYASGGTVAGWNPLRRLGSRLCTWLCRRTLGLTVSDPLSGFFALRREVFHRIAPCLQPRGYKALLEILYRAGGVRVVELPLRFAPRVAGHSKLGAATVSDLVWSLLELRSGRTITRRFVRYCLVGLSGVGVQLAAFLALNRWLADEPALAMAIAMAMLSNFVCNNHWTFADRRLDGRLVVLGLLRFILVSGVGAAISHALAIRAHQISGWPTFWTSLIGITVATVWNYQLNSGLTWGLWRRTP